MLTLLLAAAQAAAPAPPAAPVSAPPAVATAADIARTDPDVRCLSAYLLALGRMQQDPQTSGEDKASVSTIVTYFLGKLDGRQYRGDIKAEVERVIAIPEYVTSQIKPDIDRCGAEATARTQVLNTLEQE